MFAQIPELVKKRSQLFRPDELLEACLSGTLLEVWGNKLGMGRSMEVKSKVTPEHYLTKFLQSNATTGA